jgi:hypothetical protein
MVKLQVLGNNSKTVNNIKNLTWGKNDQHSKIYLSCNFEVDLITHLGKVSLNFKNVQHVKIYPPCNFEVNSITHFGVISLFSSNFQNLNPFRPLFQKL